MKTDLERLILVGILAKRERLRSLPPDNENIPWGIGRGRYRVARDRAGRGVVPITTFAWLGRQPTGAETKAISRELSRMEADGLLLCSTPYGSGARRTHVTLTVKGELAARAIAEQQK